MYKQLKFLKNAFRCDCIRRTKTRLRRSDSAQRYLYGSVGLVLVPMLIGLTYCKMRSIGLFNKPSSLYAADGQVQATYVMAWALRMTTHGHP